jgi:mannose-6-phosphate isomerase-like protein (cupin superfamily)
MKKTLGFTFFSIIAPSLAIGFLALAEWNKPSPSQALSGSKPLLLEKNEGEAWTRRSRPVPTPASQIMLKVSPRNNGSEHLVLGTETVGINGAVPIHKHLDQDEVLLINSGTVRASVGDKERDLHSGGLVFVPANTWVGLRNISQETVDVTFIFSAPGFGQYVRCTSVPANEKSTPLTQEEWQRCQHDANAVFKPVPDGHL